MRGAMQATGVEESGQEACERRFGAASGRWFVGSGTDGVRSSGRLDSSLELRAERTDDGVLVAPLGEGSERIVWVADMRLTPSSWPRRLGPPRLRCVGHGSDRPEIELRWRGLPAGQHALHFTVLCRPEGRLTFENADFDPTVQLSARDGSTSLVIQPYTSLPPLEVVVSGVARLAGEGLWARGVGVLDPRGGTAAEDRFSPGPVLIDEIGGEICVRVKVLGDGAPSPPVDEASREFAWIARSEWAACATDPAAGGLAEWLGRAAADPSGCSESIIESLSERANGGPLWSGLEALPRWDERVPGEGPVAVEHAAQLVTILKRRACATPAAAREADLSSRWFRERFWLSTPRRLADRALGGHGDRRRCLGLRPHMLIAAGLAEVPLRRSERRALLDVVAAHLLTARGLRSLDPEDFDFDGGEGARGAVWPWLVAPLCATVALAGGVDRLRLRSLVALALAAADAPEAWVGSAGDGGLSPAGKLVFGPNRRASGEALSWLSGILPGES